MPGHRLAFGQPLPDLDDVAHDMLAERTNCLGMLGERGVDERRGGAGVLGVSQHLDRRDHAGRVGHRLGNLAIAETPLVVLVDEFFEAGGVGTPQAHEQLAVERDRG
jgi:hypothetical protein